MTVTVAVCGLLGVLGTARPCAAQTTAASQATEISRLTVKLTTMATGTENPAAGNHGIDTVSGVFYVPPQCVGPHRCPAVVSLGYQPSPHAWHRQQANRYGMLLAEPPLSVSGIDAALHVLLQQFAVDPAKIALVSAGGQRLLQVGGDNLELFSRIGIISYQFPYAVRGAGNAGAQFLVEYGLSEGFPVVDSVFPRYFADAFQNAQRLRQAGYPVRYAGLLRRHLNCREDYEDLYRWLAESWGLPLPVGERPMPHVTAGVPPRLTPPILDTLIAVWTSLRESTDFGEKNRTHDWAANDSVTGGPVPTHLYRKELTIPLGTERQVVLIADMPALAAHDTAIAARLKAAGLTAMQEEAYRIAFISALSTAALVSRHLVPMPLRSVLQQNVEFVRIHPVGTEQLRAQLAECHVG